MSNKVYISEQEIKLAAVKLAATIEQSNFKPDVIVAITRGGMIPAGYVSYFLNIKNIDIVTVSSYEGEDQDVNLLELQETSLREKLYDIIADSNNRILFVDDLIDTGNTLKFIDDNMYAAINILRSEAGQLGVEVDIDWRYGVLYTESKNEKRLSKKVFSGYNKPSGWLVFPWDTK